jgi:hypothetical protein
MSYCVPGFWLFPLGWGSDDFILPICVAEWVGGRLWLTGFPLCFCAKYGNLARTDLKNERISRSGGFQACYEIIREWVNMNRSVFTMIPMTRYGTQRAVHSG